MTTRVAPPRRHQHPAGPVDRVLDLFFGVLGLAIRIGGDLGVLGLVTRRQGGPGPGTPRCWGPRRGGGIRELAATHHPLGTNRFLADAVGATVLVLEGLGARVIVRLGLVWVIGCGHVDPRSYIALASPSSSSTIGSSADHYPSASKATCGRSMRGPCRPRAARR